MVPCYRCPFSRVQRAAQRRHAGPVFARGNRRRGKEVPTRLRRSRSPLRMCVSRYRNHETRVHVRIHNEDRELVAKKIMPMARW